MSLQKEFAAARSAWQPLTLYQKFEHVCILILTGLIAIVIVFAIWNLALKILISIFTILDLKETEAMQLFALSAAILALSGVYWLVREQDRRHGTAAPAGGDPVRPSVAP